MPGCPGRSCWRMGRSFELIADIFNLPNMLFNGWGVQRVGTDFNGDFHLLAHGGL